MSTSIPSWSAPPPAEDRAAMLRERCRALGAVPARFDDGTEYLRLDLPVPGLTIEALVHLLRRTVEAGVPLMAFSVPGGVGDMTEVTIRPATPVPDEPRLGDRAWIGEPHQVLAAALTSDRTTPGRVAEVLRVDAADLIPLLQGRVGVTKSALERLRRAG